MDLGRDSIPHLWIGLEHHTKDWRKPGLWSWVQRYIRRPTMVMLARMNNSSWPMFWTYWHQSNWWSWEIMSPYLFFFFLSICLSVSLSYIGPCYILPVFQSLFSRGCSIVVVMINPSSSSAELSQDRIWFMLWIWLWCCKALHQVYFLKRINKLTLIDRCQMSQISTQWDFINGGRERLSINNLPDI